MAFLQIIEFESGRIDEFNANLDKWMAESEGKRIPHHVMLCKDRDAEDRYLFTVQFSSYDKAMENSSRPETAAFAAFLSDLCDGPLAFRNLDVMRVEDM